MEGILDQSALFVGIAPEERVSLLACLDGKHRAYPKGAFLLREGDAAHHLGLLLAGAVDILQEDFWGNRSIVARIEPGELYGEAFACAGVDSLPLSALAVEDSEVIEIDCGKILRSCPSACPYHGKLLANMMGILAEKNIALTRKMEHLSRRSIREKLLSYLSQQAQRQKSSEITIPFNRQELADFLCVERSALSRELSAMARAGIIDYEKNRFLLHS